MASPATARGCVLLRRDLWDVDRYVISADAVICEPCVTAAQAGDQ